MTETTSGRSSRLHEVLDLEGCNIALVVGSLALAGVIVTAIKTKNILSDILKHNSSIPPTQLPDHEGEAIYSEAS